ncbi:class I SAM-dependent methyltransferase [Mycolicibacterium goodii]|uniref:class I SAM-dependent methyltransferase n=1 Tax=Mycolicibacterium goodii TaxID=134601 RepID=UPI000C266F8A|nr:class I SAM-dependent methyltransferase [Mycolicibacterium goodii]PJK22414.1 SAM-dependent methyltransferase [Mycolicibacterium goodii]
MSEHDRTRWDAAYTDRPVPGAVPGPPRSFAGHVDEFPTAGSALDVACGSGENSVWLAQRGLHVWGFDVSPVAVTQAEQLAVRHGVAQRCRFDVADLDDGLPDGAPVDVVLCHRFRDPRLYRSLRARLAPGGLLAICVLSRVGAAPGPFRASAGELRAHFGDLRVIAEHEGDGEAWLLARVPD